MAPGTTVELDDLSDHDLLITIAEQTRCLPDMQDRLRDVEKQVVALQVKGGILAVLATALGSFIGALYPRP